MTSKVEKRRREILNIIDTEGFVYIPEMAKLFNVTNETIRNDFDYLSEIYGLKRIHGGLEKEKQQVSTQNYQYNDNKHVHVEEKKRICYHMVSLLKSGDCIYVDGGTTVSYLLNYLKRKQKITIVTPSIVLLMHYILDGYDTTFSEQGHKLIFVGGQINSSILTTYGCFFNQMLNDFNFDKMIFSTDAIDLKGGITNSDEIAYAIIKKAMLNSKEKYLLIDSSKFGKLGTYRVMDWQEINAIVTEKDLDNNWIMHLENHKIQYVKA